VRQLASIPEMSIAYAITVAKTEEAST